MTDLPGMVPVDEVARILKQELKSLDRSVTALSRDLGVGHSTLKRVLDGERPMSPDLAARLWYKFYIDTKYMLVMQVEAAFDECVGELFVDKYIGERGVVSEYVRKRYF